MAQRGGNSVQNRFKVSLIVALTFIAFFQIHSQAQNNSAPFDVKFLEQLQWRSIGPANMGGRTCDVEGVAGNPAIVYVGTASGGIFKTTNGGTTWTPIFERQSTISIGDLALDPNNPEVIWAGTGESNTRNSVSFGDGVYKSLDGGKTWQHMGLRDSERISRIVINPQNPDIVYVGALGHAFGPHEERGVFMTTDGGKSWQKTLYIDREHGVSDLEIDASNPNILYAGMWSFERKPWTHRSGSEQGGVYKSIDGGRTWKKLTEGLPKLMGRIGVKVAPSNTNTVYVIVESKEGTLYRSTDRGETFTQVSKNPSIVSRGFYYTDLRVDPVNENRIYAVASTLFVSIDGGQSFRSITGRTHIDYHALWIDPRNPKRLWQGQDGGVAVSYDQGETWDYANNFPIGQFYHVHADNRLPFYYVMGGLQDNGSWSGPSRSREPAGIMNDDWRMVSFGDGFQTLNHEDDPELYLSESQGGNIVRTDFRTREQQLVATYLSAGGAAKDQKYRFNWNAPFFVSPHDKNTVYLGGNIVFKSTDFGKTWAKASNDLTTNDQEKLKDAGGPVAFENSSAEFYSTIISLAESPVRAGVLWAGTDDGNLQITMDGGKTWNNIIKNVSMPAASPVSHIELSRTNLDTAYVAFERHMFDDFRPYIFKTTDGGKSWKNISGNLPAKAYLQVVREDPRNPDLIYAGTELGLFASYNNGANWLPMNLKNFPNVSVHDIKIHPRENDLILATHGRSLWIFDDATPLQQMNAQIAASDAHLFDIRPALRFSSMFTRYGIGDKPFTGPNTAYGALITYYLKDKPAEGKKLKLEVFDSAGKRIREILRAPTEKGLNRVAWDLAYDPPKQRRPSTDQGDSFFGGGPRGPQALPGTYTVKLTVGDKTIEKRVEVRLDPTLKVEQSELRTVFDLSSRLRDMISSINESLRTLDSIKAQLQQIEKTVKDRLPDTATEQAKMIGDYVKQIDALSDKMGRMPEPSLGFGEPPRLIDKLFNLFFTIDGVNAAPTPAQRETFDEVAAEVPQRVNEVNKFINETVAQMNEALKKAGLPVLIAGKAIDVPR